MIKEISITLFYLILGLFILWFAIFFTTKKRFMNHKAFATFKTWISPWPLVNYFLLKSLFLIGGLLITIFGISLLIDLF